MNTGRRVGSVIVTYNHDERLNKLVEELLNNLDIIVIVDNGSKQLCDFRSTKIVIIRNEENIGLASALNIGCEYLYNNGYYYTFLFDQDSFMLSGSLEFLIETIKSTNAAIVGPRIQLEIDNTIHEGKYLVRSGQLLKRRAIGESEIASTFSCITSGSLVDLKVWKYVSGFWDDLFIEMIDNEYCMRVIYYGYEVMIDGHAILIQQLGDTKMLVKKLGTYFIPTNHSANRYFYMYRNLIWTQRRYGFFRFPILKVYYYLAFLKKMITIKNFETDSKGKKKLIQKGIREGYSANVKRLPTFHTIRKNG